MPPRIGITGGHATTPGSQPPTDKPTLDFWNAIAQAGGTPVVLTPASGDPALLLAGLDGVLFTGGEDIDPPHYGEGRHPALGPTDLARDDFELALFELAWRAHLPILGVCRGMQIMNVARGGTLYQDLPSQRSGDVFHAQKAHKDEHVHALRWAPGSRLGAIMGEPTGINSLHHQAVKDLAPGFTAVAWSPDGVVEAMEGEGPAFRVAMQWHPEILASWEEASQRLFRAFVEAAS